MYKMFLVTLLNALMVAGCYHEPPPEESPSDPEIVTRSQRQILGPDICRIQTLSAEAIARAQDRTVIHPNRDRDAWNIAQVKAAALIENHPELSDSEVVNHIVADIRQLYTGDSVTDCSGNPVK